MLKVELRPGASADEERLRSVEHHLDGEQHEDHAHQALDGDEGARAVLARHRGVLLEFAVDDDAGWQDIDTPSDLAAVNRRLGRP